MMVGESGRSVGVGPGHGVLIMSSTKKEISYEKISGKNIKTVVCESPFRGTRLPRGISKEAVPDIGLLSTPITGMIFFIFSGFHRIFPWPTRP